MTYESMRMTARTGDVLLVRGNRFVRIFSAESVSHVAVLVWMPGPKGEFRGGGLWVFEFVEGEGYQSMPASQWFERRKGQMIFHGVAPDVVRAAREGVYKAATRYRTEKGIRRWYGWLSLVTVWASQIIRRPIPVWAKVCSTFAQEVWEAAGFREFERTADPGDFMELCQSITRIEEKIA
ncbi:hypothetical protein [Desulfuromonas sp. TF]|uniref:hypothetical protein n=1 Tax=Desulfuromonas sp. TF TaxID=1232410 RepID=UPI00041E5F96|nr:hypothetical protein [Desulfuromonas sp. TF]